MKLWKHRFAIDLKAKNLKTISLYLFSIFRRKYHSKNIAIEEISTLSMHKFFANSMKIIPMNEDARWYNFKTLPQTDDFRRATVESTHIV